MGSTGLFVVAVVVAAVDRQQTARAKAVGRGGIGAVSTHVAICSASANAGLSA